MKNIIIQTPKGERKIGPGEPCFIIAEMSGNHNHDFERAKKMIDAAVEAGVDAVKLQTYTPDTMTINCDKSDFLVGVNDVWKGKTLYELYEWAHTPWEWQKELKEYSESKRLLFFSTPFDTSAVDFLEGLGVPLYKVASFESGDIELLQKIGSTKKPVIISRGMTSVEDLELAINTLKESGAPEVAALHCVSSYPATADQMNLATIEDIRTRFNVVSGLSDHSMDSLGIVVPLMGVALGASIIEKHFTLRRADGGPDAAFSLEPEELKQLVQSVREAEQAIGKPNYITGKKESENLVFRRSLYVIKDMKAGDEFTRENVRCIRPGHGLEPKELPNVLGKTATKDVERGVRISWDLIS
ncbi:MAG: pseudaminic acid synthase [Candidatus Magasanikbacteria bacterium]|nr:pseudaminic acid synthase [Candidatus Magasanikbacteria bacterium]|tara:strand:- start:1131 stop:2201 length:1071 start_codon:yes stop_codon:yes gene_type:complete